MDNKTKNLTFNTAFKEFQQINIESFSVEQKVVYDIIVKDFKLAIMSKVPLLMIIVGQARTGKSYLVNAV